MMSTESQRVRRLEQKVKALETALDQQEARHRTAVKDLEEQIESEANYSECEIQRLKAKMAELEAFVKGE